MYSLLEYEPIRASLDSLPWRLSLFGALGFVAGLSLSSDNTIVPLTIVNQCSKAAYFVSLVTAQLLTDHVCSVTTEFLRILSLILSGGLELVQLVSRLVSLLVSKLRQTEKINQELEVDPLCVVHL